MGRGVRAVVSSEPPGAMNPSQGDPEESRKHKNERFYTPMARPSMKTEQGTISDDFNSLARLSEREREREAQFHGHQLYRCSTVWG